MLNLEALCQNGTENYQYYKYTEELFKIIANITNEKSKYFIKLLQNYIIKDLSLVSVRINYLTII